MHLALSGSHLLLGAKVRRNNGSLWANRGEKSQGWKLRKFSARLFWSWSRRMVKTHVFLCVLPCRMRRLPRSNVEQPGHRSGTTLSCSYDKEIHRKAPHVKKRMNTSYRAMSKHLSVSTTVCLLWLVTMLEKVVKLVDGPCGCAIQCVNPRLSRLRHQ